jgi:hypothetical protein
LFSLTQNDVLSILKELVDIHQLPFISLRRLTCRLKVETEKQNESLNCTVRVQGSTLKQTGNQVLSIASLYRSTPKVMLTDAIVMNSTNLFNDFGADVPVFFLVYSSGPNDQSNANQKKNPEEEKETAPRINTSQPTAMPSLPEFDGDRSC